MPADQIVTENSEPANMEDVRANSPDLFEEFPGISISSILEENDSDEEMEQPVEKQTTKQTENAEMLQTECVPTTLELKPSEKQSIKVPVEVGAQEEQSYVSIEPNEASNSPKGTSTSPTDTSTCSTETTALTMESEAKSDEEKQSTTVEIGTQDEQCCKTTEPMKTAVSDIEKQDITIEVPVETDFKEVASSETTEPTESKATRDGEKSSTTIEVPVEIDIKEAESSGTTQPTETSISPIEKQSTPIESPVEIDIQAVTEPTKTSVSTAEPEATNDEEKQSTIIKVSVESSEIAQLTSTSPMELEAASSFHSTTIEVPVKTDVQEVADSEITGPTDTSTCLTESEETSDVEKQPTTIEVPVEIDIQEAESVTPTEPLKTSISPMEMEASHDIEKQSTTTEVESSESTQPIKTLTSPMELDIASHIEKSSATTEAPIEIDVHQIESSQSTQPLEVSISSMKSETTSDVEKQSIKIEVFLGIGDQSAEATEPTETFPKKLEATRDVENITEQSNLSDAKTAKEETIEPAVTDAQATEVMEFQLASAEETPESHRTVESLSLEPKVEDTEPEFSDEITGKPKEIQREDVQDEVNKSPTNYSQAENEENLQPSADLPHEKIDGAPAQLEVAEKEPSKDERPKPAETVVPRVVPISDQVACAFMTKLVEFLKLKRVDLKELTESQSADEPETMVTSFQALLELYFDRPTSFPTDLITIVFEALAANCPEGDFLDLTDFIADLQDETKPEYNAAMMKLSRLLPILEAKQSTVGTSEAPKSFRKRGKLTVSANISLDVTPVQTPRRRPRRRKKKISEATPVAEETVTKTTTKLVPATIVAGQRRVKGRGKGAAKTDPEVKVPVLLTKDVTTTLPEKPTASTSTQLEEPPASRSRKRRTETRAEKKKKGKEEEKRKKIEDDAEENLEKDNCMTKVLQRSDGRSLCNEISVRQSCELFEEVTEIAVQSEELQLKIEKDEWNHPTDVKVETGSDDFFIHSKVSRTNFIDKFRFSKS